MGQKVLDIETQVRIAEHHLRMNCHSTELCPICQAEKRGYERGVKEGKKLATAEIAEGN